MNKSRVRASARAIVWIAGAGATQLLSAQPSRESQRGGGMMYGTSQYGSQEILWLLIGIAVLVLLVVLVVRVSNK